MPRGSRFKRRTLLRWDDSISEHLKRAEVLLNWRELQRTLELETASDYYVGRICEVTADHIIVHCSADLIQIRIEWENLLAISERVPVDEVETDVTGEPSKRDIFLGWSGKAGTIQSALIAVNDMLINSDDEIAAQAAAIVRSVGAQAGQLVESIEKASCHGTVVQAVVTA